MSDQDSSKALLRRLARLDDAVVLQRMRAHGLWPSDQPIPPDPDAEAAERQELERELRALGNSALVKGNLEQALRAERLRRWQDSKKRRALERAEREAAARLRRQQWDQYRAGEVVHSGIGVSRRLNERSSDADKLAARKLPQLDNAAQLAAAMEIPIERLRWLCFHRRGATVVHYHRYELPKKTGGTRAISAPKPALAQCQRWILDHLLQHLPITDYAHGFVRGRSVLSNAQRHVGKRVLCNLDLRDFFPSVSFARVRGLFASFGYSGAVATLLALLCTEPPRAAGEIHADPQQRVFHIALGDRRLPQGACTSPAITNLLCSRLDHRLHGLARRFGYDYSRYADDLSFSGDRRDLLGKLLGAVRRVISEEGFNEHQEKTSIMGRGARQEVTGVVVNDKLSLPREDKRRLRAILHNAARHGLDSQNRTNHPDFAGYLRGWVAYACMVEPNLAEQLKPALMAALGNSRRR